MYALIPRDKIHLPARAVLRMPRTWQDYCALLDSRGDGSVQIKYRNGEILLMDLCLGIKEGTTRLPD
ncbi:hypothetical protein [Leptodesmis sp.]|uniref:hypothetical protein n=1 Tax=Leptodesmis sp. TaxID=3100501 RepID=UPI00405351E5